EDEADASSGSSLEHVQPESMQYFGEGHTAKRQHTADRVDAQVIVKEREAGELGQCGCHRKLAARWRTIDVEQRWLHARCGHSQRLCADVTHQQSLPLELPTTQRSRAQLTTPSAFAEQRRGSLRVEPPRMARRSSRGAARRLPAGRRLGCDYGCVHGAD